MRLKSLSVKGFKSFADDTVINFNENLIGIVGPNGSGKSNIVDAIRWVLGEQKTSELRLESMSDVLFNGTKTRKEGRVARVTLSFDNTKNVLPTDYNEVSISRILYRDGNSEYRLNNVTCRKKDITSLFLDSGIGSNSYAIISLNMVEDILHDNGGSRRYMIEQAAGISKYKIRKKETLSKLKSTSEDLERVNDLLFEIEKNLSSFERQAKRTEKYNILKAEYKELSIAISKMEIVSISESLKDLRTKLQNESDQKIGIEKTLNEYTALIEKYKKSILESEISLSKDQQRFNSLIEELGKTENEKNLLNQDVITSSDRLKSLDLNEENLTSSSNSAKVKIESTTSQLENLSIKLEKRKSEVTQLDQEHQKLQLIYQELRTEEKRAKDEFAKKQIVKSNAERELESFSAQAKLLTNDIDILNGRLVNYKSNEQSKTSEYKVLTNDWENASQKAETIENDIVKLTKEDTELFEKLNKKNNKKNKKELEISSLKQRIKFIQNIIENNEGVPEAVKYLLQDKKDLTLFSDIITITDDSYTSIVELFFEPYLHHILVNDKVEGLNFINKIKEAQKGKIKEFVLNELATTEPQKDVNGFKALISIISCDAKHQNLINNLCQNVFLYDGTRQDVIKKSLPENAIVLLKDEYLIISNNEMYGGSNTLFEGVQLGRKQIFEKLIETKDKIEIEVRNDNNEIIELREKKKLLVKDIDRAKAEKRNHSHVIQKKQQQLYQFESSLNSIKENQEQLTKQIAEKERLKLIAVEQRVLKENHISEMANIDLEGLTDGQLTEKINDVYNQLTTSNQTKESSRQYLYQLEGENNILKKEQEFHSNMVRSVQTQLSNIVDERKRHVEKSRTSSEKLIIIQGQLATLYADKDKLQKKLSEFEDSYYKEKGKIFEKEKELNELRNKLSQKESFINSINEKISTLQFDLKAIHDRNEIEFGFRIKEIEIPVEYESVGLNDLKFKKEKLHDKIRGFGEINPMAITAYNEIKERHEHISKEQNDILEAKISLEETIKEVEEAASTKFIDSLNEIKVNFKKVFQGLFSEDDDCDIILMDTDNPLEARIEIVAKPKGKRPKSISLLSGGEKTLTAASFLFALYLLKPAPFCIFDEVDAPLDDVNVQKFNKIIRQFSADSQFIIITHNKLTMAEVDILYGVFLKEQGVSGVSAVDFRKYDDAELLQPA